MKHSRRLLPFFSLVTCGLFGLSFQTAELNPAVTDKPAIEKKAESAETNQPATSDKPDDDAPENDGIFRPKYGESFEGKVVVLKIGQSSLMGKSSFEYLERIVKKADLEKAEALIFDMDTPGGEAWRTESLVMNGLMNTTIPTYTFVNTRAFSAGSIIAIGTDKIYMRPAATIGSALAVTAMGEDLPDAMKKKVQSGMVSMMRNVAEKKGHNPDVAAAFVSDNTKVKIGKETIHNGKTVLNLNTIEATKIINGKPVLAAGEVKDVAELISKEELTGPILRAEPLGMESFALWVQMLSPVLIILGIGGAYMELKAPGFGIPGGISVLAFTLFFFGNNLAGRMAGFELAVLLILGLILIAVEFFLLPGTLIPAVIGIVLVIFSLGTALIDGVDADWKFADREGAESWAELIKGPLSTVTIGLIGAVGAMLIAMRFLPESKLGSWMVLKESVAGGASIGEPNEETGASENYVGLEGIAESDLRPAGKGRFDKKFLDITADGEFIEAGTALKIVKHEGSRIVVEQA